MGFDFELKNLPGEQLPHANALSWIKFGGGESDNIQLCFVIMHFYFDRID